RWPLRDMLAAAPALEVRLEIGVGALLERHCPGDIELRLQLCGLARLDGVDTFMPQLAGVHHLCAGIGEAVKRVRTKAHLPRPSVEHEAINPRAPAVLGNPLANLQIEPTTIRIH